MDKRDNTNTPSRRPAFHQEKVRKSRLRVARSVRQAEPPVASRPSADGDRDGGGGFGVPPPIEVEALPVVDAGDVDFGAERKDAELPQMPLQLASGYVPVSQRPVIAPNELPPAHPVLTRPIRGGPSARTRSRTAAHRSIDAARMRLNAELAGGVVIDLM